MSHPIYCPLLREVTMLYCGACPQKKLLPRDQLVSSSPCLASDFTKCALFVDVMKRLRTAPEETAESDREKEEVSS